MKDRDCSYMYGDKNVMKNELIKQKHKQAVKEAMKNPDVIKKLSGENNHMWKGGISKDEYCPIFHNREYREYIRQRDNNTCQNPLCLGKIYKNKPSIHHINYDKKDCRPLNLTTVCIDCNNKANKDREFWQQLYYYKNNGYFYYVMLDIATLTKEEPAVV